MYCQLENCAVHYDSIGEGRPVLALPGWGLNLLTTAQSLEPFFQGRAGWQRIYLDPPGHGHTAAADEITDLDGILQVILDFVDQVLGDQRFLLIGVSLGAYLARGVLFHRGDMIDGIAMIVPVIIGDDARRTVPPFAVLEEDPAVTAELSPEEAEILQIAVVRNREVLGQVRSFIELGSAAPGDLGFRDRIRADPLKYALGTDVDAVAEPFSKPALIVTGRQDAVVGYQDAWRILDNFPHATFAVLDRAGHLTEEKEDLIRALMHDWLDRVERSFG